LINIITYDPIEVYEFQVIPDYQLFSLTNNLGETDMYISYITPISVVKFEYDLLMQTYIAGPYSPGEECPIYIDIEGKETGSYVEIYEIHAYWGSGPTSKSAEVCIYNIEVRIIVLHTNT